MEEIKNTFSSSDLELITGIKSHTIRMWERRYQLFQPLKAGRNIRYYNIDEAKKMLNVALLNKEGYKISKIANMSDEVIEVTARELIFNEGYENAALKDLKIAMYQFDANLFEDIYTELLKHHSFDQVFFKIFVPFLDFIGLLWQTSAITPSHEHFMSHLIERKLLIQIEQLPNKILKEHIFVLYLIEGEVHELGLLFTNYLLKQKGYRTIYLGRNVPLEDLLTIDAVFPDASWINHFTVNLSETRESEYCSFLNRHKLLNNRNLIGVGRYQNFQCDFFIGLKSIKDFTDYLESIK